MFWQFSLWIVVVGVSKSDFLSLMAFARLSNPQISSSFVGVRLDTARTGRIWWSVKCDYDFSCQRMKLLAALTLRLGLAVDQRVRGLVALLFVPHSIEWSLKRDAIDGLNYKFKISVIQPFCHVWDELLRHTIDFLSPGSGYLGRARLPHRAVALLSCRFSRIFIGKCENSHLWN